LSDDMTLARRVIALERQGLDELERNLPETLPAAVDLLLACQGHVIVAGVGKSGHIGQKIAASLASTGTPAFFLHPTEASHGDLGMVTPRSVLVAISYSGESRELADLLRYCQASAIPVIGLTRGRESTLGRMSQVLLELPRVEEACPNGLAPTASTTVTLALGDALTVAAMARRGFSLEEFGHRHPGGKLGRGLQTVQEYLAMRPSETPTVGAHETIERVIIEISAGRRGCVGVLDAAGRMTGMITDGDLRRALGESLMDRRAEDIMTRSPYTFGPEDRMAAVVRILTENRIGNGFVLRDGHPVGVIDLKDLVMDGYV